MSDNAFVGRDELTDMVSATLIAMRLRPSTTPSTRRGAVMDPSEPDEGPSLLRRARDEKGWGVKGLASRLTTRLREQRVEVGKSPTVTPAMVRVWERGYPDGSRPQARHREQLCALYGKTEAELGIDRASWPWPRHKPAKAAPRARIGVRLAQGDQARMRYDSDDRAALGRMAATPRLPLLIRARPSEEGTEMERQRFLRLLTVFGLGTTVEGIENVLRPGDVFDYFASGPETADHVLDASGSTDGTLADLEAQTCEFWRTLYGVGFAAGNAALIVPMRAHLGMILRLIDRPEQPAARRRLCSQAAQMTDLLRVAAQDLGLLFLARRYSATAFKAACQAEQPALAAQILAGRAGLEVGSSTRGLSRLENPASAQARMERGLGMLQQALAIGERDASRWTLACIRSLEAQAYGTLGQLAQAEASLEAGEQAVEVASPEDRPFPCVWYDGARFVGGRARTYLRLGMPALAQAALFESMELHGAAKSVNAAVTQLDLTMTHVQQDHLDTALTIALPACQLATELPVTSVRVHAHELRLALAPHRHVPEVQALDERLCDLAA
jgi:hypothetical protein